jgi:hypothetical protein
MITATNSTGSATAEATVTANAAPPPGMTIVVPQGIIWSSDDSVLAEMQIAQTGIPADASLHIDPLAPIPFTTAPGPTFDVGINTINPYGAGSGSATPFGPLGVYTETPDGTKSNETFVPVIYRWNHWCGDNNTDKCVVDVVNKQTCLFNIDTSVLDLCLPLGGSQVVLNGTNLTVQISPEIAIENYDITTGAEVGGILNSTMGPVTNIAGVNQLDAVTGIVFNTTKNAVFLFNNASEGNLATYTPPSGAFGALGAVSVNTGCGTPSNAATAVFEDTSVPEIWAIDFAASTPPAAPTVTALRGSAKLTGFATAEQVAQVETEVPVYQRYLVTWPNSCNAGYLGPVINPDTNQVTLEVAVIGLASGNVQVLGVDSALQLPLTAIRLVPLAGGDAVIIVLVDENGATTPVEKVSWTGNSPGNLAFTNTPLPSLLPSGVALYGDTVACHANGKCDLFYEGNWYPLN